MLDSAPLPPPVTKAAPPPMQQGYDGSSGMQSENGYTNGMGNGQNGHGGMDVDQPMVA